MKSQPASGVGGTATFSLSRIPDASIKSQIQLMEAYLRMKLDQKDWHGVADAAMDIRELEAVLRDRKLGHENG